MEELPNNHESRASDAAEAAFENQIAKSTRAFLENLELPSKQNAPSRLFLMVSIAASILILVIAVFTINLSHSDQAIAEKYGINQVVTRSGQNVYESNFTEAVKAYYKQDYVAAQEFLSAISERTETTSDFQDWLELLITLQTVGSSSETFKKQIDQILANEGHEFFFQAKKMHKDLSLFWRRFAFF